ncbi:MAG: hypothetical protein AB8E15_12380 [Bdellovibrionales bacterium]
MNVQIFLILFFLVVSAQSNSLYGDSEETKARGTRLISHSLNFYLFQSILNEGEQRLSVKGDPADLIFKAPGGARDNYHVWVANELRNQLNQIPAKELELKLGKFTVISNQIKSFSMLRTGTAVLLEVHRLASEAKDRMSLLELSLLTERMRLSPERLPLDAMNRLIQILISIPSDSMNEVTRQNLEALDQRFFEFISSNQKISRPLHLIEVEKILLNFPLGEDLKSIKKVVLAGLSDATFRQWVSSSILPIDILISNRKLILERNSYSKSSEKMSPIELTKILGTHTAYRLMDWCRAKY